MLSGGTTGGGMEWWVQVKDATSDSKQRAIDLSYDKDEALAKPFGVGSFPVILTVTYLTPAYKKAASTIVFEHIYAQGEHEIIDNMLTS
jgi:hypothetical protein